MKKTVLIVEDEEDIKNLISFSISKDNIKTESAENGRVAYDKLLKNNYDLIIMDWMLPEISGLKLISWMRKSTHSQYKTPILMVTAKSDPADIVLGLESGADDYIVKPFDFDVLRARVQNLLQRRDFLKKNEEDVPLSPIFEFGNLVLNKVSHEARIKDQKIDLTYSEFKILEVLLSNRGKVLSRKQIIKFIQGQDVVVTGRTIDTHLSSLRKKLGEYGEKIKTVRGVGYRVTYD